MKAIVYLADGFEEIEALAVVDLLRRAEIEVETVSIMESFTVQGRSAIRVEADRMWSAECADGSDLLVLPGGQPGTTYLGAHEGVKEQLLQAVKDGRYVSAICAAPTVLASHGILDGKEACCYPGLEGKLTEGGARVRTDQPVIRDGRILTSRGAGTAVAFGIELIAALIGRDKAEEIRRGIVADM